MLDFWQRGSGASFQWGDHQPSSRQCIDQGFNPAGSLQMIVVGKHFMFFAYCGLVVEIQPLNC